VGAADRSLETALVVVVDEATDVVAPFRQRHLELSVRRRIPPHVTLLYPFVPADGLDDGVLAEVSALARSWTAFGGRLAGVRCSGVWVWLEPEPLARFAELRERARERFPSLALAGGPGAELPPHLTIGRVVDAADAMPLAALAELELGPSLPLAFRVDSLTLLAERPGGSWARERRFPLSGS
jgi:2'-5' RNA ligase